MGDDRLYPILRELAFAPRIEGSLRLAVGQRVGRFEILRELGSGSFGHVYEARDAELGRHVAIKTLRFLLATEVADNDARLVRVKREAEAVARLQHPNIVTLHDVGVHEGMPFLVFELLAGESLRERLHQGRVPLIDALDIATQIARGLAHAHDATVIHRDLNPNNVFVLVDGRIKLLDFGLARMRDVKSGDETAGTPAYMAPEQWRGEPATAASDVFSAGVVLYEMLAGELPFSVVDGKVLFEREAPLLVDVPGAVADLVAKALRLAPAERYANGGQLAAALADLDVEPQAEGDPFRYLDAFSEADAGWFFGRSRETARLKTLLATRPVVCVMGPSGAGKSSLVRAGLLPRMRREGWTAITVRPGAEPMQALERACDVELAGNPAALGAALRARGEPVLLLVDQLEELFTRGASADERTAFVSAVLLAADDPAGRVRAVLTLREDQISRLATLPALRDTISQGLLLLGPPDTDDLLEALVEPARRLRHTFEDGLANDIVTTLAGNAAPLPLLQLTASRMWEARDRETRTLSRASYERLAGVRGIIATHAEGVFRQLMRDEQRIARELLLALVSPERTAVSLEREALVERASDRTIAGRVLELLVAGRLVASVEGSDQVRLAHEAIIDGWDRLGEWLEELGGERKQRERLARAAATWDAEHRTAEALWSGRRLRDELRRGYREPLSKIEREFLAAGRARRRIRIAVVAAIGLLVIAAGLQITRMVRTRETRVTEAQNMAHASAIVSAASGTQDPLLGALLLAELRDTAEPPGGLRTARQIAEQPIPEHLLRGHIGPVNDIAYAGDRLISASHDGRILVWRIDGSGGPDELYAGEDSVSALAIAGPQIAAGFHDGTIRLWRERDAAPMSIQGPRALVAGIALEETRLAVATKEGARVWALAPDGAQEVMSVAGAFRAVAFAGDTLLLGGEDGTITRWLMGARTPAETRAHAKAVTSLAVEGDTLVSASEDGTVRVWSLSAPSETMILRGHAGPVRSVRIAGDKILSAGDDGTARIWSGGEQRMVMRASDGSVLRAVFDGDATHIATGATDHTIRIWPASGAGQPRALTLAGTSSIDGHWSPRGDRIVTQNTDGTLAVWTLDSSPPIVQRGATGQIFDIAYAPDGGHVLAMAAPNEVLVWPTDREAPAEHYVGHTAELTHVSFAPSGQRFATASADKTARVWWLDRHEEPLVLEHATIVRGVAFSRDGKRLATISDDGTTSIWPIDGAAPAKPAIVLPVPDARTKFVAWSHDGTRVATTYRDGTVRVWSLATRKAVVLHGHGLNVMYVAFSADDSRIATASGDHTARVFRTDGSGTPVIFSGHEDVVFKADFSPDGQWVISSSRDNTIRIWRADGRGETEVLPGQLGEIDASGTRVLTVGDGMARVWIRAWRDLVAHLASATTACLSSEQRHRLLAEGTDDAEARAAACERAHGRPPLVDVPSKPRTTGGDMVFAEAFEPDTNREGTNYKTIELEQTSVEPCRKACVDDAQCRAFTIVKAGVFGPKALCYLKDVQTTRRYDRCCISGLVRPN